MHVKLYLDIIIGDVKPHIEHDWSCVHIVLASQVRDLNQKSEGIWREQQYQCVG